MNTKEEIQQIILSLPEPLQKYIMNANWRDTSKSIAASFGLDEDQTGILKSETFYVLLGLSTVADFRTNLITEAEVTYDQALKVTSETNSKIFGPVMSDLKALESKQAAEEIQGETATASEPVATGNPAVQTQATAPVTQPKPAPEPPKNLPTQEHILVKQDERPVYMLTDHDHVKQVHAHTPSVQNIPTQPQTIIDQKLSQIVKLPKEEVVVDLDAVEEKRKNSYRGNDPYREPIE